MTRVKRKGFHKFSEPDGSNNTVLHTEEIRRLFWDYREDEIWGWHKELIKEIWLKGREDIMGKCVVALKCVRIRLRE